MHIHFDRVRVRERIQLERRAEIFVYELRPHIPLGEKAVNRQIFYIRCESLVQPQVRPPLHRHQIPEPLVRQFVGDDDRHPLPGLLRLGAGGGSGSSCA